MSLQKGIDETPAIIRSPVQVKEAGVGDILPYPHTKKTKSSYFS